MKNDPQKRKPISIRFALRAGNWPKLLICRITVDGDEDSGFAVSDPIGESVRMGQKDWDSSTQRPRSRDSWLHDHLPEIETAIKKIFRRQLFDFQANPADIPKPTRQSVKFEYRAGHTPWVVRSLTKDKYGRMVAVPDWAYEEPPKEEAGVITEESPITEVLATHIIWLRMRQNTPEAISPITLARWERAYDLLIEYCKHTRHTPSANRVTVLWGKQYRSWLQRIQAGRHSKQQMSPDQASRYLKRISEAIDVQLLENELIERNPLAGVKWPRAKDKPIYYLDPDQIRALLRWRPTKGTLAEVVWWFGLMCLTGMDYPDAVRYVDNPEAYEVLGPGGWKICMKRNKGGHAFDVPITDDLRGHMAAKPQVLSVLHPAVLNRYTDQIAEYVGTRHRLTVKNARKSAGAYWLDKGYNIREVSRMLGHKSIVTTERYYVKILGDTVDRGMMRVNKVLHTITP